MVANNNLDLLLDRESILMLGGPGSGKSDSVVRLALDGIDQGFKVAVIDRDRGLSKAVKDICKGKPPDNLSYFLVKQDWRKLHEAVDWAFEHLKAGDWLVFEMLGNLWDFMQMQYSKEVYGEDVSTHLLTLRKDAQKLMDEAGASTRSSDAKEKKDANTILGQKMQYSGMEGRTDWAVIKRMHNVPFERVLLEGDFHVLATTSVTRVSQEEMNNNLWPEFHGIGKRPEGEKHSTHRFDTIVYCERSNDDFVWSTDLRGGRGKDRGRELHRDVSYKKIGFWASYAEKHNLFKE